MTQANIFVNKFSAKIRAAIDHDIAHRQQILSVHRFTFEIYDAADGAHSNEFIREMLIRSKASLLRIPNGQYSPEKFLKSFRLWRSSMRPKSRPCKAPCFAIYSFDEYIQTANFFPIDHELSLQKYRENLERRIFPQAAVRYSGKSVG